MLRSALILCFAALLWPAAGRAVIIHEEITHSSYYNVAGPEFNGIARLYLSGASVCSAFAINSFQVLTAAHCMPSENPALSGRSIDGVQFSLLGSTIYAPTSVFIAPQFDINAFTSGYDVAVLYFENGLPNVNTYPIYNYPLGEDELGDTFELFGYGRCGTPQQGINAGSGACSTPGLHRAANRYDQITANGLLLEASFDSYNPATISDGFVTCRVNDALCQAYGIENPSKADDPAVGTRQGLFSAGDSGGPSLLFREGRYYSVGMHSFITCLTNGSNCANPPDFDASASPNSSWGEFGSDTRLAAHTSFVAEAVPEPSTFVLAGLATFYLLRRRYMLNSSKSPLARWTKPSN